MQFSEHHAFLSGKDEYLNQPSFLSILFNACEVVARAFNTFCLAIICHEDDGGMYGRRCARAILHW